LENAAAAFGIVDPDFLLRAPGHHMQRQSGLPAAQVPKRRIDRAQGKARDRADRGRMRMEEQVLPDLFDHRRIAPEQLRTEMVADERHDRRTAVPMV